MRLSHRGRQKYLAEVTGGDCGVRVRSDAHLTSNFAARRCDPTRGPTWARNCPRLLTPPVCSVNFALVCNHRGKHRRENPFNILCREMRSVISTVGPGRIRHFSQRGSEAVGESEGGLSEEIIPDGSISILRGPTLTPKLNKTSFPPSYTCFLHYFYARNLCPLINTHYL